MRILIPFAAAAMAACSQTPSEPVAEPTNETPAVTEPTPQATSSPALPDAPTVPPASRPTAQPKAFEQTIAAWRQAENRAECAPLVLTNDGGQAATPRRASFAGGWGIAFDQPKRRSAYGVAGAGVRIENEGAEIERISRLFPYVRPIGGRAGRLPGGTTAAYGIEGASAYSADNPSGRGEKSLAYVVVPGQRCLYNVWSSVGREHLETLLDHLTMVPTD